MPKLRGWGAALLTLFGGVILYLVSLRVAVALSDTEGDRYIPIFRFGQFIGMFAFLVGLLSVAIVLIKNLVRFLMSLRNR